MACRLDGAKPSSEPRLEYCKSDPWLTNVSKILIEIQTFIEENTFENVVCEMLSISSRPQCVLLKWSHGKHLNTPWVIASRIFHEIYSYFSISFAALSVLCKGNSPVTVIICNAYPLTNVVPICYLKHTHTYIYIYTYICICIYIIFMHYILFFATEMA